MSANPPAPAGSARFHALVLAGSRGGAGDDLAAAQGEQHRALIPVRGVPMLVRVIRTLRAAPSIGTISVSIDDPAALDPVAELRELVAAGALKIVYDLLLLAMFRKVKPPESFEEMSFALSPAWRSFDG